MAKSAGTPMSSIIAPHQTKKSREAYRKKGIRKNEQAQQCILCFYNIEGRCTEYNEWCSSVRRDCTISQEDIITW